MDKQDDKQERVIPKLRFPEFQTTLGWKPSSISKTCRSFSGGTPNTANKHFYGGKIPFIRSAEIALEKTELFLTEEGLNNSSAKMVNKGDVLVALYGANSGNVALSKIDGAINQAILCLQHQNNNAFLYHFLSYNQEKIVNTYIQGGQGNLSGEIIKSIKLPFPSPKEQQKIADCLSSIDELIELQEQKLAALKQHKKGLMQQLFPSHNDLQASKQASTQASKQAIVYPKLRFPQFKDCKGWEVVELEELFDLTIQNEKANSFDKDKIITVKLHTLGVVKNERTDTLTGGANYFHRKAGDFIFSKIDFLNGAFGIVPNELDGFCSSSDIPSFSFKPESNANFFMYWLKANYLDFKIERAGTSNTLKRISPKALFAMQLPIPLPEEQQAIADCLSSLDKLISEENEQIGRLKDHKKGLMQQLFPKIQ